MPPKSTVVIRMNAIDFTGKSVFHCHVTFHEHHGVMAAVFGRQAEGQRSKTGCHWPPGRYLSAEQSSLRSRCCQTHLTSPRCGPERSGGQEAPQKVSWAAGLGDLGAACVAARRGEERTT
jgi:Multicopper oxidase